jgi:hypothetical protein
MTKKEKSRKYKVCGFSNENLLAHVHPHIATTANKYLYNLVLFNETKKFIYKNFVFVNSLNETLTGN